MYNETRSTGPDNQGQALPLLHTSPALILEVQYLSSALAICDFTPRGQPLLVTCTVHVLNIQDDLPVPEQESASLSIGRLKISDIRLLGRSRIEVSARTCTLPSPTATSGPLLYYHPLAQKGAILMMYSETYMEALPKYSPNDEHAHARRRHRHRHVVFRIVLAAALIYGITSLWKGPHSLQPIAPRYPQLSSQRLAADHKTCAELRAVPKDPSGPRQKNARYNGGKAVLIKNATVWTGEPFTGTTSEDARVGKGYEWIPADVLLEHGMITRVETDILETTIQHEFVVYQANGRLLTAGIVDMHSHTDEGVDTLPALRGGSDDNELSNDITPYVKSIDGLNPLDPQIQTIKSGGVTTSLILPGSGNNMGGEAFVIKHAVGTADGRSEISQQDLLADPDRNWRYMKMACGENPKRVYGRLGRDFGPFSRLGEAWYFRHAFEQAQAQVQAQDDWCLKADEVGAENMHTYLPNELQWESLGALLRGQVLLNTHCYTIPDLEAFIRHTNEFRFKIRAFHHAHQTYLVPEVLKRAYGGRPPAAALFADNMYYKDEAYIASEQAGKILYDNGITPVYVSDNPVLNAQHVVFEAAKAYMNGLPYHVALAGVTSASAELLGLGERIGKVKPGFDADVVVWDSDPLSVGAAPVQVWIDGAPQFQAPLELAKADLRPLIHSTVIDDVRNEESKHKDIIFSGVTSVVLPHETTHLPIMDGGRVVVRHGRIVCTGTCDDEIELANASNIKTIQLQDGHIAPPLTAFGSFLGLVEIAAEKDTQDGDNDAGTFSAAVEGLAFDTKNLKAAYRRGVTRAVTAPAFKNGGHLGVSTGFSTGAFHALEKNAVWSSEVAVHYTLTLAAKQDKTPSISSAVLDLKRKLLKAVRITNDTSQDSFEEMELVKVVNGTLPLVLTVHSADVIATILSMKKEVESASLGPLNLIILGGAESHLLAPELAAANVSVVLAPLLAYSDSWDQRRSLTGVPLTNGTAVDVLFTAGVKVAIGSKEDWETRDLGLYAGIAHANSRGMISEADALAMVSTNVYEMLDLTSKVADIREEFAVYEGHPLKISGRVRAVADRGVLTLWTQGSPSVKPSFSKCAKSQCVAASVAVLHLPRGSTLKHGDEVVEGIEAPIFEQSCGSRCLSFCTWSRDLNGHTILIREITAVLLYNLQTVTHSKRGSIGTVYKRVNQCTLAFRWVLFSRCTGGLQTLRSKAVVPVRRMPGARGKALAGGGVGFDSATAASTTRA
nr:hypothetical protein CFP56_11476 [Quercus suber]